MVTMIDAFRKAGLKKGEKILIQTATGGTGLIAVQTGPVYDRLDVLYM
jgi:NADPH:quinone reductase-like Zn-dependent oxidoreductase